MGVIGEVLALGEDVFDPGLPGVLNSLGFLRGELSIPNPLPRPLPADLGEFVLPDIAQGVGLFIYYSLISN